MLTARAQSLSPAWTNESATSQEEQNEPWPFRRRQFERRLEAQRLEPGEEAGLRALRRGWYLGSAGFKEQMLKQMEDKHAGELRRESAQAKAERTVAEELKRLGWKEAELVERAKSDPAKLEIAARLRRETTLTIKATASRTQLGTSKSANARLPQWMNKSATRRRSKTNHAMVFRG